MIALLNILGEAFELLFEARILELPYAASERDLGSPNAGTPRVYTINKIFFKYLLDNDLIYNHLFGFNYILDRYTDSVVKFEVQTGEDKALGTGWLFDIKLPEDASSTVRVVVTNAHVIDGSSSIKVLSKDDKLIQHYQIESFFDKTGVDIALIQIDYDEAIPAFVLESASLLEEIITIGYPAVRGIPISSPRRSERSSC